jgi:hypothetical protein
LCYYEGFFFHDVGIFGNGNDGCDGLVSFFFFSFCNGHCCYEWWCSFCCWCSYNCDVFVVPLQWLSLSCVLLANIFLAMVIVMFFLLFFLWWSSFSWPSSFCSCFH